MTITNLAGMVAMAGTSKHNQRRSWLRACTLVFFLAGLVLATAWDADGDPSTDNLPPATLAIAPRTVSSVDEESNEDHSDSADARSHQHRSRARRRKTFLREWHWRFVAVPSRGP